MASDKKEQESKSWFSYRTAAKAIYDLDYEITPGNLNELKKIKGIGKVMFDLIKSILPEAMISTAQVLD
jgi:DNA polymerase/3'-5' exonuclease PolX